MKTETDTQEYRTRFMAAQAEVADFQATGMLNAEAQSLLTKLPPIEQIADDKVRTCVSVGNQYNRTFVAIANAVGRHAKTRDEVSAFCGMWNRNSDHAPYNSNIRRLLRGSIFKRIANDSDVTLKDLTRAVRWFYHQVKTLAAQGQGL
jgi:hypothetical protein